MPPSDTCLPQTHVSERVVSVFLPASRAVSLRARVSKHHSPASHDAECLCTLSVHAVRLPPLPSVLF